MSLLEETLKYGSLFLALKEAKIKEEEILRYIQEKGEVSLPLGLFFMVKGGRNKNYPSPFYRLLQEFSGEEISVERVSHISTEIPKEEIEMAYQLFGYYGGLFHSNPSLAGANLILHSRDKVLIKIRDLPLSTSVDFDFVEHIRKPSGEDLTYILQRIKFLSSQAPLYYKEVAFPYYKKYLNSLEELFYGEAKKFAYLGLVELDGKKGALEYNLSVLSPLLRYYVLGLPLKDIYTQTLPIKSISHYSKMVEERNRVSAPTKNYFNQPLSYSNEEDSLYNNVFSYSSEDIAYLVQDKHCFIFTRPEFPVLAEKGKNFYTNEELPLYFLREISSRCISHILNIYPFFPYTGKPVKEMLEALERM